MIAIKCYFPGEYYLTTHLSMLQNLQSIIQQYRDLEDPGDVFKEGTQNIKSSQVSGAHLGYSNGLANNKTPCLRKQTWSTIDANKHDTLT